MSTKNRSRGFVRTTAVAAALLTSVATIAAPRLAPVHAADPMPFGYGSGVATVSSDGVAYTLYSGKVPSFDGTPLAADVTIPANTHYPLPLIVFSHGLGFSRTEYEAQTKASTNSSGTAANFTNFNNVSFAARGYAVLTYTDRGLQDLCGPTSATTTGTTVGVSGTATLPTACQGKASWIHLADPRWEMHDIQHLIGMLVDEGVTDKNHIGISGMSYGGGHTWDLAELNDRIVNTDGTMSPWTSPVNHIPLHIAAAAPQYTWSDLQNALTPNGRARDTDSGDPATLETAPVGIAIQSYLTFLYGLSASAGTLSMPGVDPTSDLTTWNVRIAQGEPYADNAATDPTVHTIVQQLRLRSPLYITPDARVPIFQAQGFTDPLFPPVQAIMMRNHVLDYDPTYPIKSYFGDIGHPNAANPADEWAVITDAANSFFDYYLKGTGTAPTFDVTAQTTDCVSGQTRQTFVAPTWPALHDVAAVYTSTAVQTTSQNATGTEGVAADPFANTAAGCPTTAVSSGTGEASWSFPITATTTLMGQPTIDVDFSTTGTDAQLNGRLWDVAPGGATETLMSRGAYRYLGTANTPQHATYQISANAWVLQPGHTLRLEVVGNDAPYLQADKIAATTTISSVQLSLPIRTSAITPPPTVIPTPALPGATVTLTPLPLATQGLPAATTTAVAASATPVPATTTTMPPVQAPATATNTPVSAAAPPATATAVAAPPATAPVATAKPAVPSPMPVLLRTAVPVTIPLPHPAACARGTIGVVVPRGTLTAASTITVRDATAPLGSLLFTLTLSQPRDIRRSIHGSHTLGSARTVQLYQRSVRVSADRSGRVVAALTLGYRPRVTMPVILVVTSGGRCGSVSRSIRVTVAAGGTVVPVHRAGTPAPRHRAVPTPVRHR